MQYFRAIFKDREEISVRYDHKDQAVWFYLNPKDRPRLSNRLVTEALDMHNAIKSFFQHSTQVDKFPIKNLVVSSQTKDIFNYGGDMDYFLKLVESKDEDALFEYTKACVDNVYLFNTNLDLPLQTIAVVEGTSLGGGFELALSCSTLIADKSSKMGFPESRFNLFPGVGGYTFLAKSLGIKMAEKIIKSGHIYNAQEMHEMGIVDHLVDEGSAINYVKNLMKKENKNSKSHIALLNARKIHAPTKYDELMQIAEVWMKMILSLDDKSIRSMKRIIKAQDSKGIEDKKRVRTYQDRRIYQESNINFERRVLENGRREVA